MIICAGKRAQGEPSELYSPNCFVFMFLFFFTQLYYFLL